MTQIQHLGAIPGLPPTPVIGGRLGLIRLFSDPVGIMFRLYREHGSLAAVTQGDPTLVCAFGADYNQQLLSNAKQYHNFSELPFRVPDNSALSRFTLNLTAMNGDTHRLHRRLMMPAFHKQVVQSYRDTMVAISEKHLAQWSQQGVLDMSHEMLELTLMVMVRCLFGLQVEAEAAGLGHLAMHFLQQITSPSVMMFPVDLPGTPYRRFLRFCEDLEQRFRGMIQERRGNADQSQDVLSLLIQSHDEDGTSLSDDELVGHTGLLFVAGHETTAFALAWTLYLLAQHPRVCADLFDELDSVLQGNPPTIAQLQGLPLLDAVVKESMRLIPPTPMLFLREGVMGFQLGPYNLPPQAKVVLSPLITHRFPDIFSDPDQFKPSRWETIKPSPYDYLPFGAGPRMCIGAGFADLEIRLVLSMTVQRFQFQVAENAQVDYKMRGITLGPKRGIPMQIRPQDRDWSAPSSVRGNIHTLIQH